MIEQLKNIKPNEAIQIDPISYVILFLVIVLIFSFIALIFMVFNLKKRKLTSIQQATILLKKLDFQNIPDKTLAYVFTKYGRISLNPYYEDEYVKIIRQLEKFKYKKYIPAMDDDLKAEIKEYIKVRI